MTLLKFIYYVPYVSSLFLFYFWVTSIVGLHRWCSGEESTCKCRRCKRCRFDCWVRKIPWRRQWQPTPVFLPEKFHGQRSLVGYSPWGHKVRPHSAHRQHPLYGYTTFYASLHYLVNSWVVCRFWLLWIMKLWTFERESLCKHIFLLLLGKSGISK